MSSGQNPQRKRGIRASRRRLTHALTECGYKTQAALAERIADLEDLESAPKDMVNRAFREMPVEPQSLERIARALGVEAHTLYKTADEANDQPALSGHRGSPEKRSWFIPNPAFITLVALVVTGSLIWWLYPEGSSEVQGDKPDITSSLTLGRPTLVLLPIVGDEDNRLGEVLREQLSGYFSVASETVSALTQSLEAPAASDLLRTDATIDGEIVTRGRLIGVRFYLYAQGVRQQIWAESWQRSSFGENRLSIADNIVSAVRRTINPTADDKSTPPHFPLAPVQDDYLEGEYYLDRPVTELNIKRAESRFEAALRQDANFARAHAGLCQALLEEHWMGDEERALLDASRTCGQALQLDPQDSVVAAAHAHFLRRTADNIVSAVRRTINPTADDKSTPPHFPLAPVQDDYLEGEYYLDRPVTELNIKRAESRFEAALRQDANFARAHAGLCQALLEEHWMGDEERALLDASRTCGQALQLDPQDSVVAAAHAHFLRRTGRNGEAIELYNRIIDNDPGNSSALSGLASSLLAAFRQEGNVADLLKAKEAARGAAEADPFTWRPLWTLATMEWFDGNVEGAISASESALARDENENILGNLGTFYLCQGYFEKARGAYQRAREVSPASYVGDEFLGQAHYFLGNYELSASLRQKAIDTIATGAPEIHEMWGNLGDSYRQSDESEAAVKAYQRAAEIAERDHLRGTAPNTDRVARAYYYTMISSLNSDLVPESVTQGIRSELDEIEDNLTDTNARRRMAVIWLEYGEVDKARISIRPVVEKCPGYANLPDLAVLNEP